MSHFFQKRNENTGKHEVFRKISIRGMATAKKIYEAETEQEATDKITAEESRLSELNP